MKSESKFLMSESPITCYPSLATVFGSDKALIIQQVRFWMDINSKDPSKHHTHYHDGRWWTYNTIEQWEDTFPWLRERTILRLFGSLADEGILLKANLHKDPRNRTLWYSIDFNRLDEVVEQGLAKYREDIAEVRRKRAARNKLKAERRRKSSTCQTGSLDPAKLAGCTTSSRQDDLYTETTNRDYRSEKNTIKCITDAPYVCNEFEFFDHHGKEVQDPEVSEIYSSCAKEIKRTSGQTKVLEKRSNGSDFSTKKEKPKRFELDEVDDRGVYILPSTGKRKLPSILTMRSVQVALGVEHLYVEIGLDQYGDLWMTDAENDEWHEEEEYCCNVMPYKRVIDTILGREDSTPDSINESIEFWWEYWTEFCREHGDQAIKKVNPSILPVIAEIEGIRLSKVKIEDEE